MLSNLHPQQRLLALLNVLGGLAILGSYALAFADSPAIRVGLWGGVPDGLRPLYTVSMLLAAAGYFPFTYQLVLWDRPVDLATTTRLPYPSLYWIYGLILIPSAMWLPLTAQMLQAPSTSLWWTIRIVLFLVALGSTALLGILIAIARRRGGWLAWAAALGGAAFWYPSLYWIYGLILIPSAMWLPLTAQMLQAPSTSLWWTIRIVLFLVAFGSTALLGILIAIARRRGGWQPSGFRPRSSTPSSGRPISPDQDAGVAGASLPYTPSPKVSRTTF